jgi:catechol 2,3-dioxygenase-like lactoylglutathione lyase family enzyme
MTPRLVQSTSRVLAAFAILCIAVEAQQLRATRVEAAGFTVSDIDKSVDFYQRVLNFRKVTDQRKGASRVVRIQLGEEQVELVQYQRPGHAFPRDSRANDEWFQHIAIVVSDMQQGYAQLRQNRVRHASSTPQRLPEWNPNAAGIEAFYFRDPDGHYLELIHFPAGKGDPRWQRSSPGLFLGIDHTAIVVKNTDDSLRFYRDTLGFRVAGESENYGTEQEHLNGVFGAHLKITALRTESGPGIELLEYLSPTDGRPAGDIQENDIAHWETRVEVQQSPAEAARALQTAHAALVFASTSGDARDSELVAHDPDQHVLVLHSAAR